MNDSSARTLGDYIYVKHGFAFKGEYFTELRTSDVLITPGNFAIGGGFQSEKLKYYAGPVPDEYVLNAGDLVVTMTDLSKAGDTLGYPALIPHTSGIRYLHNQRIGLIELKEGVETDKRYLYYRMRSDDYRHHVLASASGSTVRHTSPSRICDFETTLPPADEQTEIANVLGSLDDKIEQNRRTSVALERLARSIFRAWFVDFEPVKAKAAGAKGFPSMPQDVFDSLPTTFVDSELGPIPEGWEVEPLSDQCEIVSGGTPKRSVEAFWNGEIAWYSVKDAPATGEVWVIDTEDHITQSGLANSAAQIVPKGCTIISARGTVGRLALCGKPMTFNQSCYGLLPGDGSSFGYLYLAMREIVAELQQRTHGSVFDTITRATFESVRVCAPPPRPIVGFQRCVESIFELLLDLLNESRKLAELRDYLLPKLLSGSVRVRATNG